MSQVSNHHTRFDWLREHSSLFSSLLVNATDQNIQNLLALDASDASGLPSQNPPWIPKSTNIENLDDAQILLRQAKKHGVPYFIWWELGLQADIDTSAKHLALWASGLIQVALHMAHTLITPRFGALGKGEGEFTVIGLGKLGGWELNLGSDIDLLFIWRAEDSAHTTGGGKSIPAKEYYQHLSRLLIRLLDEQTVNGKAWLTDMRLRPNGDGAPICLSLQATLNHYQSHGQTWERAMLSKAAVVAGSESLGCAFLQGIKPFVWKQYIDFTTVHALSDMKQRIDKQSKHQGIDTGFDVKRDRGGIREIEFMIQSLQLVYAGREPELALTPSMLALSKLQKLNHISKQDADILTTAYRFWRRVEHAIQTQRGQHTHKLAEDWQTWLSEALQVADIEAQMLAHSQNVHQLFLTHFNHIHEDSLQRNSGHSENWLQTSELMLHEKIAFMFPEKNPQQQSSMVQALTHIQSRLRRNLLPPRSTAQIETITTTFLKHWQGDACATTALQYWDDLIQNISGRATWFDLLTNQPNIVTWLANMLASSGFIAKNIAKNPSWLEWPLHTVNTNNNEAHMLKIIHNISTLDAKVLGEEAFLSNLGRLVDEAKITTAITIASDDNVDPMIAGKWLSDIADGAVLASLRLALFQFDLPADFPMVALAMGKHGSQSMGLTSDLDMVFVLVHPDPFEIGPKNKNYREWSQRVGRRIIQHLSLQPPFGAGYEFDARLRPSGQSGVLVTTIKAFALYQRNEAQTWEHQALCRGRPIAYSSAIVDEVNQVREAILLTPRDEKVLKDDVKTMRLKMINHLASSSKTIINLKHDNGGLVDIEFLAQYAQLYFGLLETSTLQTFRNLPAQASDIWRKHTPFLIESFLMYRQMENVLRVHLWASVNRLPIDKESPEWETLRRHAPVTTAADLQQRMQTVHDIFKELLR